MRATPFSDGNKSGRFTPSGRACAGIIFVVIEAEAMIAATVNFLNDDPNQSRFFSDGVNA